MSTNWEADRRRYEEEKGFKYATPTEAFAAMDAKRLEDEALAEWYRVALSETRDEFYARIGLLPPKKRALVGFNTAAKRFSGEPVKAPATTKRGASREVLQLRARVAELEAQLAEINSVFA